MLSPPSIPTSYAAIQRETRAKVVISCILLWHYAEPSRSVGTCETAEQYQEWCKLGFPNPPSADIFLEVNRDVHSCRGCGFFSLLFSVSRAQEPLAIYDITPHSPTRGIYHYVLQRTFGVGLKHHRQLAHTGSLLNKVLQQVHAGLKSLTLPTICSKLSLSMAIERLARVNPIQPNRKLK